MRELLQSLLDSLDVAPLDGMVTADQVLDRTALLVAVRNATDAQLTRTVRRGENMRAPERDGLKSMRSWLRGHLRLSAREAARIVGNGRALEQLPAVASAFSAGAVTAEQVTVNRPRRGGAGAGRGGRARGRPARGRPDAGRGRDHASARRGSALVCERHHTKVHPGFRVERQPDGRWRTSRPDGTESLLAEPLRTAR